MKGGPSIAVMLGHAPEHDEGEEAEPEASDLKERAKDGAKALGQAILSKDAEATYRAFKALKDICHEIDEREGDGEEKEEAEEPKDEKESEYGADEG